MNHALTKLDSKLDAEPDKMEESPVLIKRTTEDSAEETDQDK